MTKTEAYLLHRIQYESLPWDNRCAIADELVEGYEGYEITNSWKRGCNSHMKIECHGHLIAQYDDCTM